MTLMDRERELLERIKAGDMSACDECIMLHTDSVYRLAIRMTGDESEAEDIVQETFLKAFQSIGSFEGRSNISTWLFRIAYNLVLMRFRGKKPAIYSVDELYPAGDGGRIPIQFLDWCCLPEAEFESQEARKVLSSAIHQLPNRLQEVFILRDVEGFSTRQTANILAISQAAVKTRLHRARQKLRALISDYFDVPEN